MACLTCNECTGTYPKIPTCEDNLIDFGDVNAIILSVVLRITKLSNGAVTEQIITTDINGKAEAKLENFDKGIKFFNEHAGKYKVEALLASDSTELQFTDALSTQADCILIEFTPLDNITGSIELFYNQ